MKTSAETCFVEYSFIDKDAVPTQKLVDLKKKAEPALKKKGILSIVMWDEAKRFKCEDKAIGYSW
jgi:hypothetical protein